MKKRFKKLITLGVLSLTLIGNHSIVFAEDGQEPIQPIEPIGEEVTNEQITEYNQEVDEYNQQIDEYNKQIDIDYEQEKEKIDAENASIEEFNQAEDAKAAAIQEENKQIQAQYDADYTQYEQDLATYKQKEQQILNLGYESVEQYNDTVNTYYNEPCEAAEAGNTNENNTFDIEKSYEIVSSEEETPAEETEQEKYKVEIEHNFSDNDTIIKSYKTEFEINKNDIITFKPAGTQLETYQNQYHYGFFANTDDEHILGLWYLGFSKLEELCNYNESSWDNGDVHIVSYKDGQSKPGDTTLTMIYNYYWKALKKAKTYTEPDEPKLELKEEYIPEYKEKINDPVKKDYLVHLDYLELKKDTPTSEPKPESESKSESNTDNTVSQTNTTTVETTSSVQSTTDIETTQLPVIIPDTPVPTSTQSIVENKHIISPQTGDDNKDNITILVLCLGIGLLLIIAFLYNESR